MRLIIAVFLACLLAACANTPSGPQLFPTSQTYSAPKSVVWPLVISEIRSYYPIKSTQKTKGVVTTDIVSIPAGFNNEKMGQWVIPPGNRLATWGGLRMNMSILVMEPEPGKTTISIRTFYEAYEDNVSHSWIVCETNGSLEHQILADIADKLPKP